MSGGAALQRCDDISLSCLPGDEGRARPARRRKGETQDAKG